MNDTPPITIRIVDADMFRGPEIQTALEKSGFTVQRETELARAANPNCSLVLVAIGRKRLAGSPELAVVHALHAADIPVVAYSEGIHQWDIALRCVPLLAGAAHLLDSARKSFSTELTGLVRSIVGALEQRTAEERELQAAMLDLRIVAASRSMLELFRILSRFSQLSDLPALITGETGTGKERFARAMYRLDPKRSAGPFVPVNCGALTSTLAESELFGHRRGSFTGADRDRRGLIRAAQGGVLFLDEVGELPELIQTKLLRVIQENRVLAVGEEREEPVDVRIIAATNRDLAKCVEQGTFRADLLHRLNVLPLHIPPLRERREDIKPLLKHFVKIYSTSTGGPPRIMDEVVEALEQLKLRGNVRQLENIVRRSLVGRSVPTMLRLGDLPPEVWHELAAGAVQTTTTDPPGPIKLTIRDFEVETRCQFGRLIDLSNGRLDRSLDVCERILISVALERSGGNQSETARLLQITPRSVYNKLRRHQLSA